MSIIIVVMYSFYMKVKHPFIGVVIYTIMATITMTICIVCHRESVHDPNIQTLRRHQQIFVSMLMYSVSIIMVIMDMFYGVINVFTQFVNTDISDISNIYNT